MSETKPKRSCFRFHLLTAVLMMLVAASLLYLNFSSRVIIIATCDDVSLISDVRGWPLCNFVEPTTTRWSDGTAYGKETIYKYKNPLYLRHDLLWTSDLIVVPVNILVNFTILVIVAFVCEFLIRRREARKT
jgi:hypothetical protein